MDNINMGIFINDEHKMPDIKYSFFLKHQTIIKISPSIGINALYVILCNNHKNLLTSSVSKIVITFFLKLTETGRVKSCLKKISPIVSVE